MREREKESERETCRQAAVKGRERKMAPVNRDSAWDMIDVYSKQMNEIL